MASTSILPWSGHFLRAGEASWREQDLRQTLVAPARTLFDNMSDLKFRNKLRCGRTSAILETRLPSLGGARLTTRFRFDPVSQKMTLDAFVKEGDQYIELVRSSYNVRHNSNNNGRLGGVTLLDVANGSRIEMGWINSPFVSAFHSAVTRTQQKTEVNSPFGRDLLRLLSNNEQGFVCCANRQCRQHVESLQPPSREESPGEIQRAENGETSAT